jgi:hypothetical protein
MPEVVLARGKSVFFVAVEFLLKNKDVAVHQFFYGAFQGKLQILNAFHHVSLDLFKQNQL